MLLRGRLRLSHRRTHSLGAIAAARSAPRRAASPRRGRTIGDAPSFTTLRSRSASAPQLPPLVLPMTAPQPPRSVPRARRTVQSGGDDDPEMMRMRAKMLDRLLEMAEQLIEEAEQTREKARLHGEALGPSRTDARALPRARAGASAMARKMMDELNANRGRRIASEAQAELVQMAFAFVDMSKNATLDDVAYNGEWRGWRPREAPCRRAADRGAAAVARPTASAAGGGPRRRARRTLQGEGLARVGRRRRSPARVRERGTLRATAS